MSIKKRRFILSLFIGMFLISLVGAYEFDYYGSSGSFSPSNFLENEWVVFFGLFLLIFSVLFYSLKKVFFKKGDSRYDVFTGKWISPKNAPVIPAVISLVLAFFASASLVRASYLTGYLGEAMTVWVSLVTIIVLILVLVPFFIALKKSVGLGLSIILSGSMVWLMLKFIELPNIMPYEYYSLELQAIYDFLVHPFILIILIIIGVIFLKKKTN